MQALIRIFASIGFRRALVFGFDLVAIGIAFIGSFLLRFDFHLPPEQLASLGRSIPVIYGVQTSVFISQGLYRGLWSFASIRDLFVIIRTVALAAGLSLAALAISNDRLIGWPRSIFLLDPVLLVLILGGGRFAYRFLRESLWNARSRPKRILIVGAGQSANLIAREFITRPELAARVIGFLDDNRKLTGYRIHGSPVLGDLGDLAALLEKHKLDEVIIAIPSLTGSKIKNVLAATRALGIPCRIAPPIRDVLLGKVQLSQLREVRVEDLLRREVVKVDDPALQNFFAGKRVMVTGAGGSIGSELCRQILAFNPHSLVLYERSEYNLYRFRQTLSRHLGKASSTVLHYIIGDVLDERRLEASLRLHRPDIVLHAAAYKHVPLMEENIYEAVRNNVLGTYVVTRSAAAHGVCHLVLISTDKAVRPTSVMGATKRIAELITQAVGRSSGIQTTAVRFGNVLDSEGSVLPLFREQISKGGPVTVTHKEITRYFMTIPEASLLVLQASLLGKGGEVFVLDMGEPVRIRELAEELIKLSGFKPYEEIDLVFTGLRPGEKLYEELLIDQSSVQRTSHPKIRVSVREHSDQPLPTGWEAQIQNFLASEAPLPDQELLAWLRQWVAEYCPSAEINNPSAELTEEVPAYLH